MILNAFFCVQFTQEKQGLNVGYRRHDDDISRTLYVGIVEMLVKCQQSQNIVDFSKYKVKNLVRNATTKR